MAQARAGYQSAAAQRGYSELKAEIEGVITERVVGPGTLVNSGQTVLKVSQVSPIRLQANVAEADVDRIRVGAKATVTLRGASDKPIQTRITTVSPALDPQARTGIVEAVWMNADGRILPGQYLSMEIEIGESTNTLTIPLEAVQQPASSTSEKFVWVVDGDVAHRAVIRTGISNGRSVEVLSGLTEGQKIVTKGASGLREGSQITMQTAIDNAEGPVIEVSASGFKPSEITVQNGKPVTLTFVRVSEQGCGTEVVFPSLGITRALPLNKPVSIRLSPDKTGDLNFSCGMNMLKGRVIVR